MTRRANSLDDLDRAIDQIAHAARRGERAAAAAVNGFHSNVAAQVRRIAPAIALLERCAMQLDQEFPPTCDVPEKIGEFDVIRELGRGGMGVVYEAVNVPLNRRVALKALRPEIANNDDYIARFRREAQAAARMKHANIASVYGVGNADGVHYIEMQYVEGETLEEVIARRRGEPAARRVRDDEKRWRQFSARVGLQVARAVQHAHDALVLHRDLKPSNLLVDAMGTVWVTDFGLAKLHDSCELTTAGELPGTLRYLAPERLVGQCDERSDVYAMGLIIYELLAKRPAFEAVDRHALLKQIADASPLQLQKIDPEVEPDLATIVATCLHREPALRYQSAAALADDCERFLHARPVAARRASWPEHVRLWTARNRAMAALLALAGALVVSMAVGGIAAAIYFRRAENRQRVLAGENLQLAERNAQQSEALRRNLYFAEMNVLARDAEPEGGSSSIAARLAPWASTTPDPRGWEWHYLDALCRRETLTIQAHDCAATEAAYHPDGTRLATGGRDGSIKIWDAADGVLLRFCLVSRLGGLGATGLR